MTLKTLKTLWMTHCVHLPLPEPEPVEHLEWSEPSGAFWMTLLLIGSWLLYGMFKWGPRP